MLPEVDLDAIEHDVFIHGAAISRSLRGSIAALIAELRSARAENERLRKQLDEASLRSIEAGNPGIDMDEVRRMRARGRMLADVDAADEDD